MTTLREAPPRPAPQRRRTEPGAAAAANIGSPPALAKVSPPRLSNIVPRERLFAALDACGTVPVTFVAAPAGAGKTTLAASYLHARGLPCVWLQLGADNADPSSFIYYLRLAVQRIEAQRGAKLPLLAAEHRLGQPAFARHFFASLQELLPARAVVVLDNYQDVGAHAALHAFLAEGSTALAPAGLRLLCLTRAAPPTELLQRGAATGAAAIDWNALRLTLDETAALAQARAGAGRPPSAAALERMHQHAQGWAAGLMLLLESPDALAGTRMQRSDQATFDYFAAEVLQRMDPLLRDLLPPLALASAVSHAMAMQLTGNANAGRHLDELVHSHGFTTRLDSGHYQFHPLFRNFLLDRLRRGSSRAHLEELQRSAARLLAQEGLPEEAAQLFIDAADWPGLAGLIALSAGAMLAQGRHEALAAWLSALPEPVLEADAWLLLHAGAARLVSDLDASRALFERALAGFGEAGQDDAAGLALAWASLTQTIALQWSDFSPLARWTEFAEQRIVPGMAQLAPELQGRVVLGMFIALVFHQPQHRALGAWAERLEAVASRCPDASDRLELAAYLLLYRLIWLGDLHGAERLIDAHRAQRQAAALRVGACIHWDFSHAIRSWLRNENGAALATLDGAIQLARTRGVPSLEFMLHAGGVYASMNAQDSASATRYLAQAGSRTAASRPIEMAHHQLLSAWLERVQGDANAARRRCEWAYATLAARGGPFEMLRVHLELAQALRMCGEHGASLGHGEQGLALARSMGNRWMEHVALACIAEAAFVGGDRARGLATLRAAYALAREQGYRSLIWQDPKSMALLCAQALQANIEPEHARALIAAHRLVAPADPALAEHWPFAVRIRSLGSFQIEIGGEPLRFEGKPQRKPLELLKVLLALGARDVRDERLSAILWPDAEPQAARSAFSTTLSRLRKLLGGDDTIVMQDGRISLSPLHCWLDTWALEARIVAAEQAPVTETASEAVLRLYRGGFLEHEGQAAWVVPARERYRSRFLRWLTGEAKRQGAAGRADDAIALYQRGLEIDPLIEDFYRGLIGAFGELGRRAEALAAFERCRSVLAATLGVAPSAQTRALAQRLRSS
jgi:LuxR family transcriptional regulator, maltose regulon positive regulatory protein